MLSREIYQVYNDDSCSQLDDAYARCFDECQFCNLEALDYALLWDAVDASDLVSGPTAAFTRKCTLEKLEPYAADIALSMVTWLPWPKAVVIGAKVVKNAARVLKEIVKDRRRNNVTGHLSADRETTETVLSTVNFESTVIPLVDHLPTGGTSDAHSEAKTEASTSVEGTIRPTW